LTFPISYLIFVRRRPTKFSLNFSKTDINELLNDVYAVFKSSAEQKSLTFKLELPRITLQAYVDSEALKKILSNLFNNAIKYAERSIIIKLLPFSSEDQLFNIEIRNDGYIIPAQYKEKIFEPFFRIKETEKEAGTGIGLPLSRSLAQLHKGSLELKTSIEGFNIFLLSLPIHQEREIRFGGDSEEEPIVNATDKTASANDGNLSKPAILLVEDNKEILNYIEKELTLTISGSESL